MAKVVVSHFKGKFIAIYFGGYLWYLHIYSISGDDNFFEGSNQSHK